MAWPFHSTSSCSSSSGSPAATASWARTRSMPVTASVTGCSTWRRAFSSRNCQVPSAAEQELDGAGAGVAGRAGERDGRVAERRAQLGVDRRRRRLLDDLLMAALERAVALAEVDDRAVAVGEHLHLDVAGAAEQPLEVDPPVAERGGGLAPGRRDRLGKRGCREDGAHPAPAAARGRLHHEREAEPDRLLLEGVVGQVDAGVARRHRDPDRLGQPPRLDLVARGAKGARRRADEHQAGRGDSLGELRALGQEAVAGVDGVGAGRDRRGDQRLAVEVPRHLDGVVGDLHVERPALGRLVRRDRVDPELAAGARDPDGDLAAVGDQDAL